MTYVNTEEDIPHEINFKLDTDGSYSLELNTPTQENDNKYTDYIIGVMTDIIPNSISWTGPGVAYLQLEEFNEKPTTMPQNANPENWAYSTSDNKSGFCTVGFENDNIYIAELFPDMPTTCITGTIKNNKITFTFPQYAGINANNQFVYYYGEKIDASGNSRISQIEMDYDPENKKIALNDDNVQLIIGAIPLTDNEPVTWKFGQYPGLNIFYQTPENINNNPQDPTIESYSVYNAYIVGGTFDINIPPFNVDGYLLNEDNIYYNIYINDELYTFQPETYPGFKEPTTNIPYTFADMSTIYAANTLRQIYINGVIINKFGIQVHYKGSDGNTYSSNIVSIDTSSASIEEISDEKEETIQYFNLQGQRILKPQKGMLYIRSISKDGKTSNSKVIFK